MSTTIINGSAIRTGSGNGSAYIISNDHDINIFYMQDLVNKIESSNASAQEKEEAKSLLSKLLAHPLVVSILGATAGAVIG